MTPQLFALFISITGFVFKWGCLEWALSKPCHNSKSVAYSDKPLSALHTSSDEHLFRTQYATFYITLQALSGFLFAQPLKNSNLYAIVLWPGIHPHFVHAFFLSTDAHG